MLTLSDSVEFFTQFEKSFADDICAIRFYASSQVLEELWKSKTAASDKLRIARVLRQQQQRRGSAPEHDFYS